MTLRGSAPPAGARRNHVGEKTGAVSHARAMSPPYNGSGAPAKEPRESAAARLTDLPAIMRRVDDNHTLRHHFAATEVITGRNSSWQLLVVRCACGDRHMHRAPLRWEQGLRTGGCGRRYVVHSMLIPVVAA